MDVGFPDAYQATAERLYADVSTGVMKKIPGWDFAIGKRQVDGLRRFLHDNLNELGDRSFLIELTQEEDADLPILTSKIISDANQYEPTLIKLGQDLRVMSVASINPPIGLDIQEAPACALSTGKVIVFYEQRSLVRFYANESTAGVIDPQSTGGLPGRYSRYGRRAEQYEEAILDHYRQSVRDWRTDHWADRRKRLLRANLGKASRTEDIFQFSLVDWLAINLSASVKGKVGQVTSDQTDIEITAPGRLYIIEIKWLGENENGTPYTIKRVAQGLRQIRDYLAKQGSAQKASLLVYDARSENDFRAIENVTVAPDTGCKCISECEGERVAARASCLIVFLRSTTASES